MLNDIVSATVITHGLSNHDPIIVQFKFKTKKNIRPWVRLIKSHKIEAFVEEITSNFENLSVPNFDNLLKCLTTQLKGIFAKKTSVSRDILN